MAKDRETRFQSAAEVAELLERELAHLQNPASGPAPARPWLPRQRTRRHANRRRVVAAAAVALAGATLAVVAWRPWSGDAQRPEQGVASPTAVAAPALEPPSVPLWNADGMEQVWQFAEALELGAATPEPPPVLDPWVAEMADVQQRLGQLIEETLVPDSSRSKP